jgi:hypothetical protein
MLSPFLHQFQLLVVQGNAGIGVEPQLIVEVVIMCWLFSLSHTSRAVKDE